jgi:hypothetical protein
MRAVYLLVATLGLSVASATPLASQAPSGVPSVGSRLRVSTRTAGPRPVVGAVVRVTKDTLTLRDARGVLQAISLADADRIEMSRRKVGHARTGAVVGIGVGAFAGGLYGSLTFSDPGYAPFECSGAFLCDQPTRGGRTLGSALLGALIGAGVGALIGNDVKTDRWTTISTSSFQPTASVRPASNGGAVVNVALRL